MRSPAGRGSPGPLLKEYQGARPRWLRVLYLGGGLLCLLAALLGWVLPIVSGVPFLVLGAVFLTLGSARAGRWINWIESHLPQRFRRWLRRLLSRIASPRLRRYVHLPPEGGATHHQGRS